MGQDGDGMSIPAFSFALLGIVLLAFIAMFRVLLGPHVADRVVAFSTINTLVVAAMLVIGIVQQTVIYVDVAIVYCMLSFVGTLFIAKYLEGKF